MAGRLQKGLAVLLIISVLAIMMAAIPLWDRLLALIIDGGFLLFLFSNTLHYRKIAFRRWYWNIETRMARLETRDHEWLPVSGFKHQWMGQWCLSLQLQLPERKTAWILLFRRDLTENAWRRLQVAMEWAPPPEIER